MEFHLNINDWQISRASLNRSTLMFAILAVNLFIITAASVYGREISLETAAETVAALKLHYRCGCLFILEGETEAKLRKYPSVLSIRTEKISQTRNHFDRIHKAQHSFHFNTIFLLHNEQFLSFQLYDNSTMFVIIPSYINSTIREVNSAHSSLREPHITGNAGL
jgi:hypothetical protein